MAGISHLSAGNAKENTLDITSSISESSKASEASLNDIFTAQLRIIQLLEIQNLYFSEWTGDVFTEDDI